MKKIEKIFILEDNEERISLLGALFLLKYPKCKLFIARNVNEAKEIFKRSKPFDIYQLDHDLGGEVYVNPENPNTGTAFAKFLKEKGITGENEEIHIHSWNIPAASGMQQFFSDSIREPFSASGMIKEIRNLSE